MSFREYMETSITVLQRTIETLDPERVEQAITLITDCLRADRALLVCGNGGSACDAEHITGELVGRFLKNRRAYRAVCLSSNVASLTAWSNDFNYETAFARQVEAFGDRGGVLLGISTSGNSANIVRAVEAAKARGLATIAMTGDGGGRLAALSDLLLAIPARSTPLIQQAHACVYHYICEHVEARLS
jgi:D-sedoheptulose 7-phosphate isomerase